MRNSYIVLIVLLNFALNIKAQQVSDKKILKKIRGKDIEWITGSSNLAKVKMKSTKKWGVYNIDAYYDLGIRDARTIAKNYGISVSSVEKYYDRAIDKLIAMDFEL